MDGFRPLFCTYRLYRVLERWRHCDSNTGENRQRCYDHYSVDTDAPGNVAVEIGGKKRHRTFNYLVTLAAGYSKQKGHIGVTGAATMPCLSVIFRCARS